MCGSYPILKRGNISFITHHNNVENISNIASLTLKPFKLVIKILSLEVIVLKMAPFKFSVIDISFKI